MDLEPRMTPHLNVVFDLILKEMMLDSLELIFPADWEKLDLVFEDLTSPQVMSLRSIVKKRFTIFLKLKRLEYTSYIAVANRVLYRELKQQLSANGIDLLIPTEREGAVPIIIQRNQLLLEAPPGYFPAAPTD
jgi:hypothetical protein